MGWPIFTLEIQICLIWANLKLFGATGASIALIIISYGIARVGVDVIWWAKSKLISVTYTDIWVKVKIH